MRIIDVDERLAEQRGVKILIVGPSGVGKTWLLHTLDPATTIFINIEAGDLSVQDVAVNSVRPRTWPECRDLAVYLAGANPAVPANTCYSAAHHDAVVRGFSTGPIDKYQTFFFDSITAAGRLCFAWACQQPDALSSSGKRDLRAAYGLHAREMISWLLHLQQARAANVVLLGILESVTDDFNRVEHRLQMEGAKTGRELPGIIDEVITMQWIAFDGAPATRAFVCTSPNKWSYPAKDRSGRLDQIEEPHLGKLFAKLTRSGGDLVDPPAA
jgi:AAA domain